MKRILLLLCMLLCAAAFIGCGASVQDTPEAFLALARENVPLANADSVEMTLAGETELTGLEGELHRLIVVSTGRAEDGKGFYLLDLIVKDNGKLHFEHCYDSLDRAENVGVFHWQDRNLYLIDRPDCAYIAFTLEEGFGDKNEERYQVSVDALPFLYVGEQIPEGNVSFSYDFCNAEGESLR